MRDVGARRLVRPTLVSGPARLFRADGLDFFALDADFYAERGADVGALHDGAANPDVAGKIDGAERIVKGAAARVADEGMAGAAVVVIGAQLIEVGDVFEFAIAVGRLTREGKVTRNRSGRAVRKPDDGTGNVLAGQLVADEEIDGRPGFGEVADLGDRGILFVGVREEGVRVGGWWRNFDLGSGLGLRGVLEGLGAREKPDREEETEAEDGDADDQGEEGVAAPRTRVGLIHTRNIGRVGLKTRWGRFRHHQPRFGEAGSPEKERVTGMMNQQKAL